MKLDKIDFKILHHLDYDSRVPLTELAKKINISKQGLNYRIKKLTEEKVINGFMSVINMHQLGYLTYRVYFRYNNVNSEKENEIINYFKENNHTLWVVSLSGTWDLEVVFMAKNFIQFNNMLKKAKVNYGQYFSKYNVSMSILNNHFERDYLIDKKRKEFNSLYYGLEPSTENLDELDVKIMLELSKNCRQTNKEMGDRLGVSYHTIKERISRLQSKKIIQAHRIFINLEKINRHYFKASMQLKITKESDEKRIYTFCSQFNSVVYLVEVLGDWQFEIEAEVKDQDEFMNIIKRIRTEFADIIMDYEIIQATKEHKINYFPMGEEILIQLKQHGSNIHF